MIPSNLRLTLGWHEPKPTISPRFATLRTGWTTHLPLQLADSLTHRKADAIYSQMASGRKSLPADFAISHELPIITALSVVAYGIIYNKTYYCKFRFPEVRTLRKRAFRWKTPPPPSTPLGWHRENPGQFVQSSTRKPSKSSKWRMFSVASVRSAAMAAAAISKSAMSRRVPAACSRAHSRA